MQETVYSKRVQPQRLPADAPNIQILVIDDAGLGLRLTHGGDVRNDTLTDVHDKGIEFKFLGEIPENCSLAAEVFNDYGYATDTDAAGSSTYAGG